MDEILEGLVNVPGVIGALIVGKDGLVISYTGQLNLDPDFLGATIADFFSTAEGIVQEKFGQGTLEHLSIEARDCKFLLHNINDLTFLVTQSRPATNLGLIRAEARHASEKLKESL